MTFDNSTIKQKIKKLPLCPGVYLMKDLNGDIIYVGKSKLLKNRVSQYFNNSKNHSAKTVSMVASIKDFEYIVTDTEVEALVLECNLIKKYKPKYNILLKDDKQYPYIKITMQDDFPRIYMTRHIKKDGAKYFGPYISSFVVKDTLETIKKVFKVRSCSKNLPRDIGKSRPCLYYHIGQCSAPCDGKISAEEYKDVFDKITDVLNGKYSGIIDSLTNQMYKASENLEFERAARYRDKINSLKVFDEKQKIVSTKEDNRDIVGIHQDESESCVQIFYMREGKIVGSEHYVFDYNESTKEELISSFIKQYYFNATIIPKEILLPVEFDDRDEIQSWLSQKAERKITLSVPKRGEKFKLIDMVCKNAEESLRNYRFKRDREKLKENSILSQLMRKLSLNSPPYRIECYDISNISGAQSVGACVVYKNTKELKKAYRRFNIKTVEGANDYESMREVIFRRINNAYKDKENIKNGNIKEEDAKFLPLPDLILLDGGKGHVSAIKLLLETLGEDIPVFGIVKDDNHFTRGLTDESNEILINKDDDLFKFLAQMQDEVHRFAIEGFRKRHIEHSLRSELDNIKGIGPIKRNKLMQTFLSIDRIKHATLDELTDVLDITSGTEVYNYFHRSDEREKRRDI